MTTSAPHSQEHRRRLQESIPINLLTVMFSVPSILGYYGRVSELHQLQQRKRRATLHVSLNELFLELELELDSQYIFDPLTLA
ncbi:hypothetical protein BDZ91DRAFT_118567 [Kalaharituber pfeilii]|nr:hypothetical protein BDZ91DRAFT_118567 [Kalaharituber pfeilii]